MKTKLGMVFLAASLSACSSVTGGFNQNKRKTQMARSHPMQNASCKKKMVNPPLSYQAKPFDLTAVPKDVLISCTAPNQAAAQGRLPSRFRKLTSVGGNALAGTGTLGLLADVASDSAFAYPVYDKADNDKPNMGKAPNAGKYSEFLIKQAT